MCMPSPLPEGSLEVWGQDESGALWGLQARLELKLQENTPNCQMDR